MNPAWLMRMARWARRPPSARRALALVLIITLSLGVAALERTGFWPDWATLERNPGARGGG